MTRRRPDAPAPTGATKGYEPLIRILGMLPATSASIAHALGCDVEQACIFVRRLRAVGLVRTSGRTSGGSPEYERGDGARDADFPAGIVAITLAAFMRLLDEPHDKAAICEGLGVNRTTVADLLRMAKAARLIRVAEWDAHPRGGPATAFWQVGSGADAGKPRALTRRQQNQRYWAARKAKQQQRVLTLAIVGAANDDRARVAA